MGRPINKCASGVVCGIYRMFIDKRCFALLSPLCRIIALGDNRTTAQVFSALEIMQSSTQHNARHMVSGAEIEELLAALLENLSP